jgi:hypothetical protein
VAIAVLAAALVSPGAVGAAAPVDVVIDSTAIELQPGEGDSHTGKLTLANISDAVVQLEPTVSADDGCSVTADPTSVDPGRRTPVTLAFGAGCDVEDGANVQLSLGQSVKPPVFLIKASAVEDETPNWDILVYAFLFGLGVGVAVLAYMVSRIGMHNVKGIPKLGFGTELKHLGTDWSFKDNWVGNVTIGSAALVALLAASDVLEAVLGEKPEAALGLLAVTGALAAVFVAIGPLLIKMIGKDMAVPTIGGMVLAAFVSLLGVIGQIAAVTWQGAELTSGGVELGVILLGLAIGGVVTIYAGKALWTYAEMGAKEKDDLPVGAPIEGVLGGDVLTPMTEVVYLAAPERRNALL